VTGGHGFAASWLVKALLEAGESVRVLDRPDPRLTDLGTPRTSALRLHGILDDVELVEADLRDPEGMSGAVCGVDSVFHLAAQTIVPTANRSPLSTFETNIRGTWQVLEACRLQGVQRVIVASSDKAYGTHAELPYREDFALTPVFPYDVSKAATDLIARSYFHTYGLETVVCRGSNNYGPRQYPEKLIPLMILNALAGDTLPVYGDGKNVRNWLFVEDFGHGIGHALAHGRPGETYNCGGPDECENLVVVKRILELTGADESLLEYVTDRPGHDRRYSLASEKLRGLGWAARTRFEEGLALTVDWYRENAWWWEPIRSGAYREYYERHYGRALKA